jgi:hypothetical protein
MKTILLAMTLPLVLASCSDHKHTHLQEDNCNSLINGIMSLRGEPEKINTDISEERSKITYIYFAQGYGVIFQWGNPYNGCDASDFRFEPYIIPEVVDSIL